VAGVIEAEKDGVVKSVHIKEGRVIHAASSDLNDSLGTFLRRSGKVSAELYAETMRLRGESDRRYGELLVEEGVLSPVEVYQAIRQHVEAIVWSLFSWEKGAVIFMIGDFAPPDHRIRIELTMPQVILQGIKRAPNARALVSRLGTRDTVFDPLWDTETLIEAGLDAGEHRLLQLVDGRRTLYEVCTEGPFSAADNAKLMYAFHVLCLIGRSDVDEDHPPGVAAEAANGNTKPLKIRFKTGGDRFAAPDPEPE
jgi:two-component system, OmpR family, response regulator